MEKVFGVELFDNPFRFGVVGTSVQRRKQKKNRTRKESLKQAGFYNIVDEKMNQKRV